MHILIRLHMLSELEHTFTELQKQKENSTPSLSHLPPYWSDRLEMTQNSFRAKEPVLALRRALLSLGTQYGHTSFLPTDHACFFIQSTISVFAYRPSRTELVGECWLQSARVARKAGHHQTAFNALLNAENTHLAELVIERAKWLWSKVQQTSKFSLSNTEKQSRLNPEGHAINHVVYHQGDAHQALIVLQKGVAQCFPDDVPLTNTRSLQTKGKAMLLVGRFMEETANFESNAIMKVFKVNKMTAWDV